jgi:outer membrane protein OmpU
MISRARVTFTMSGETDGGLAFGASFRADQAAAAGTADDERMTGGTVFISGEFGTLTFGDVGSAARAATGDLYAVGLTGLGDNHEVDYLDRSLFGITTGAAISQLDYDTGALYEYTLDSLSFYLGVSQNNQDNMEIPVPVGPAVTMPAGASQNMVSAGVSYGWEGLTVGLGAEYVRIKPNAAAATIDANHITASLEYEMDMFKAKAFVGRAGGDLFPSGVNRTHGGLSVEGSFDATTVTAFAYRDVFKDTDLGLGVSYDLGGGASIMGGIVRDEDGGARETIADFGLAFSF